MRFFSVLSLLSLLLGTRASSHDLREPAPHTLDVRRPILDICVSINANLVVPDVDGILTAVGLVGESHVFPMIIDMPNSRSCIFETDQ